MKKSIIFLILIITMSLLLVGCSTNETVNNNGKQQMFEIVFKTDDNVHTTNVKSGENIYPPDEPIKVNYNFVGWSEEVGGDIVEFPVVASENKTFYAIFESNQERNKKAFVDYMSKQTRVPAQNGNPEMYRLYKQYGQIQFLLAYVPTEDKIIVFDTINSHGKSSIMVEWKYGQPNTMDGMVTYETSKTYDYAYLDRVYLNSYSQMGSYVVGEATMNFNDNIEAFLENINLNIDDIEKEISGCSPDFNLYLGN